MPLALLTGSPQGGDVTRPILYARHLALSAQSPALTSACRSCYRLPEG